MKGERDNALKDLLKEEKKTGTPPQTSKKVKKVDLKNIQELSPKEKGIKKSAEPEEDPLEKLLEEQKKRRKELQDK